MSSGLNNIGEAQLPVPRELAIPDPVALEMAQHYKVLLVTVPVYQNANQIRSSVPIRMSGDTITVLEVVGGQTVGISLNVGKQYIPCREGDILERQFTQFRVKSFQHGTRTAALSNDIAAFNFARMEVLLLVSFGRVLTRSPLRPGFTAGSPKFRGTAPALGQTLFGASNIPFAGASLSLLKWGGTMLLRNRSLSTSLFLYEGAPGVFTTTGSIDLGAQPDASWEVLPGEVLSLDAASRISQRWLYQNSTGTGQLSGRSLCIAGDNAAVPFTCWLSGTGDYTDPDGGAFDPTSFEYDGPI